MGSFLLSLRKWGGEHGKIYRAYPLKFAKGKGTDGGRVCPDSACGSDDELVADVKPGLQAEF